MPERDNHRGHRGTARILPRFDASQSSPTPFFRPSELRARPVFLIRNAPPKQPTRSSNDQNPTTDSAMSRLPPGLAPASLTPTGPRSDAADTASVPDVITASSVRPSEYVSQRPGSASPSDSPSGPGRWRIRGQQSRARATSPTQLQTEHLRPESVTHVPESSRGGSGFTTNRSNLARNETMPTEGVQVPPRTSSTQAVQETTLTVMGVDSIVIGFPSHTRRNFDHVVLPRSSTLTPGEARHEERDPASSTDTPSIQQVREPRSDYYLPNDILTMARGERAEQSHTTNPPVTSPELQLNLERHRRALIDERQRTLEDQQRILAALQRDRTILEGRRATLESMRRSLRAEQDYLNTQSRGFSVYDFGHQGPGLVYSPTTGFTRRNAISGNVEDQVEARLANERVRSMGNTISGSVGDPVESRSAHARARSAEEDITERPDPPADSASQNPLHQSRRSGQTSTEDDSNRESSTRRRGQTGFEDIHRHGSFSRPMSYSEMLSEIRDIADQITRVTQTLNDTVHRLDEEFGHIARRQRTLRTHLARPPTSRDAAALHAEFRALSGIPDVITPQSSSRPRDAATLHAEFRASGIPDIVSRDYRTYRQISRGAGEALHNGSTNSQTPASPAISIPSFTANTSSTTANPPFSTINPSSSTAAAPSPTTNDDPFEEYRRRDQNFAHQVRMAHLRRDPEALLRMQADLRGHEHHSSRPGPRITTLRTEGGGLAFVPQRVDRGVQEFGVDMSRRTEVRIDSLGRCCTLCFGVVYGPVLLVWLLFRGIDGL